MKKIIDFILKALRILNLEEKMVVSFISQLGAEGAVRLVRKSDNDLDDEALLRFCKSCVKKLENK